MLALALVPTLSRTLAFVQGGGAAWAEVCTPGGMQRVSTADSAHTPSGMGLGAAVLDACALCPLAGSAAGPLPSAGKAAGPSGAAAEPAHRILQAARTLHAWRSIQARAPPLLA